MQVLKGRKANTEVLKLILELDAALYFWYGFSQVIETLGFCFLYMNTKR